MEARTVMNGLTPWASEISEESQGHLEGTELTMNTNEYHHFFERCSFLGAGMTLSSGGQGHETLVSCGEDALTLVRSNCFALGVLGFEKDCPVGVGGFLKRGVVDDVNVGPVGVVGR